MTKPTPRQIYLAGSQLLNEAITMAESVKMQRPDFAGSCDDVIEAYKLTGKMLIRMSDDEHRRLHELPETRQ